MNMSILSKYESILVGIGKKDAAKATTKELVKTI